MCQRKKTSLLGLVLILPCIKSLINSPFAEVTSYFTVPKVIDQLPEAGECSPSMIWILNKHGARSPVLSRLNKMKTILPNLRDEIVKAWEEGKGNMLEKDVMMMKQWNSSSLDDESDRELTLIGHLESRAVGNRWRKRVEHLFRIM